MIADPHAGQPVIKMGRPLDDCRAAMIMLHGRNGTPRNILDLVPRLDRPDFAYVAPAAANRTWYPLSFLSEIQQNEPWLSSALGALDTVVSEILAAGVPRSRIFLLGFSQGACLSAEFVYRHPGRYGGVVLFSGGLVGPPGTTWSTASTAGALDGTPVFLGGSDVDTLVPRSRVEESAEVFSRMGAEVITRIYPGMGHLVSDDEIACAQTLMDRVLA